MNQGGLWVCVSKTVCGFLGMHVYQNTHTHTHTHTPHAASQGEQGRGPWAHGPQSVMHVVRGRGKQWEAAALHGVTTCTSAVTFTEHLDRTCIRECTGHGGSLRTAQSAQARTPNPTACILWVRLAGLGREQRSHSLV
jgi:hypothetical protein